MTAHAPPLAPHHRRRSVYADRLLEFPDLVFSDGRALHHRGQWREYLGSRIGTAFDGRLVFEIGCNDASMLAAVASRHPSVAFIGIDWKCRALHTAAGRILAAGLHNVALLHGRAQEIRKIFADEEVDEVWVFHPDPFDKPGELANRLLTEPFLLDVHCALRGKDALLVLKTDHRGYYHWLRSEIETPAVARRFEIAATSSDYWHDSAIRSHTTARCFAGEPTFFERRFMNRRQPIYYLEMKKC